MPSRYILYVISSPDDPNWHKTFLSQKDPYIPTEFDSTYPTVAVTPLGVYDTNKLRLVHMYDRKSRYYNLNEETNCYETQS